MARVDAGLRTAGFIAVATFIRPLGGWLGDRFKPMYLLTGVFTIYTIAAILLAFSPSIGLYTIGSIAIAVSAGIGNGVLFKLVPMYFQNQAGIVNGIVSMMGGLGGFFPPLILSIVHSITGHYAIGFMLLSQMALASLVLVVWMYYHDRLKISNDVFKSTGQGIMVTHPNGKIIAVNPAFTTLTGYNEGEIIGKTPSVLKSGKQSPSFYQKMWKEMKEQGQWQGGEIWNKRKSGELYLEWLNISTVKDEAGDPIRYVASFSDITEHKKDSKVSQS